MGQPSSTIKRASRRRPRGVKAALAWDTKASWLMERFLDSSTPQPEAFTNHAHSHRVVTQPQPTCLGSTSSEAHAAPATCAMAPPSAGGGLLVDQVGQAG